jgi:hypothetical protein
MADDRSAQQKQIVILLQMNTAALLTVAAEIRAASFRIRDKQVPVNLSEEIDTTYSQMLSRLLNPQP